MGAESLEILPKLVAIYYWLTPAFWAADVWLGANLRTAALEDRPGYKGIYYLFCLACGAAIWLRPAWTRLVGLTEASVNILLLVLGVLVPYFRLIDELASGGANVNVSPFGVERTIAFLLAGGVWTISFRMHAAELQPRSGRPA